MADATTAPPEMMNPAAADERIPPKRLFAFISRNARTATAYFGLPPNRVVELGAQIQF